MSTIRLRAQYRLKLEKIKKLNAEAELLRQELKKACLSG